MVASYVEGFNDDLISKEDVTEGSVEMAMVQEEEEVLNMDIVLRVLSAPTYRKEGSLTGEGKD